MSQYLAYACYTKSCPEIVGWSGIWDSHTKLFYSDGFEKGVKFSLNDLYVPAIHGPIWPNDRYMRRNKFNQPVVT